MPSLNGFNANDVDPNVGFEPVPAGKYLAVIVDSRTKQTKNGAGEYLQLEFEIVDGPYKGRKVWERLTLRHPNETTVKIAKANLSAICRAVGVMKPSDSVELHGIPLTVVVGLKKREDNGEMTNVVKAFERRETASVRPSAVSGSAPPWKR
jgi:hypothetical protein